MFGKHSRRKTIIVDGKIQTRIVLATSLPMLACLLLAIVGEYTYFRLVDAGRIQTDGTILGMPEQRIGMLLLFVSASMIQLTVSLLASHKVAGVSYHIRRILHEYRQGDRKARVRLRKGDFQLRLGDDVNSFLEWLDQGATPLPEKVHSHESAITPGPAATSSPPAPGPPAPTPAPVAPPTNGEDRQ